MSARDTSGSAPQHSHPHNNTMSRNEKSWVNQVTVPHPPQGNDKGWGTTKVGGGGTKEQFQRPVAVLGLSLARSGWGALFETVPGGLFR